MDQGKLSTGSHLLRLSTLGINFALCTFVGLGLGWFLHNYFGLGDWTLMAGLFFGIAAGAWTVYQQLKSLQAFPRPKGPSTL